jgi:regulation of enolase protein 1 (concanavalin A-like superfamily)
MARTSVVWREAEWINPPMSFEFVDDGLVISPDAGSDFWQLTSYGFSHDSGHAVATTFLPEGALPDSAMEVTFQGNFAHQFDQAGLLLRVTPTRWIKAGVELSDGSLQLGAVVTSERSDWSLQPVPDWRGRPVTIRASVSAGAATIRARCGDSAWQLVRVAPLCMAEGEVLRGGPFACAPTNAGLTVRFTRWETDVPDSSLH